METYTDEQLADWDQLSTKALKRIKNEYYGFLLEAEVDFALPPPHSGI